ncbi:hypothetical protein ACLK13_09155 [Escherichia coli]
MRHILTKRAASVSVSWDRVFVSAADHKRVVACLPTHKTCCRLSLRIRGGMKNAKS